MSVHHASRSRARTPGAEVIPFRQRATSKKSAGGSHNKGKRFPPDPPSVEEVVQVLNACTPLKPGPSYELSALRLRTMIITYWRTGLRCQELLDLEERDLMPQDRALVVRAGKGDKRRVIGVDEFTWRHLDTWRDARADLPAGPIICVLTGDTAGQALAACDVRRQFAAVGRRAGLKRRFYVHGLRHACAIEMWREGIPLNVISKQLGHARLDVTDIYLQGLAPVELLEPIGRRRAPMMLVPTIRN